MARENAQRADQGDEQPRTGRRPEHNAKVGNVEIAVWKNQGTNGDFFTASSPVIRYMDSASGEFKDGSSYNQIDLLGLSEAALRPAPRFASFPNVAAETDGSRESTGCRHALRDH